MTIWARAAEIAAETPESRNRLVDFLRAASILAVISGHWLLAAPFVGDTGLAFGNMLRSHPWTQWLSWAFQVMPIFFLVGGYANAVSWRAATRDRKSYAAWLDSRLRRLLSPVLPLVIAWVVIATVTRIGGASPSFVQTGAQLALIPIWFLAIYTLVVLLVPITHAAWQQFGFISFGVPVLFAMAGDWLFFAGHPGAGWLNYLFIWLAVHQLGYAWADDRLRSPIVRIVIGLAGLATLVALTVFGPYPIAMISVPGEAVSNTLPPKLPVLALCLAQVGLVLAAEKPLRRWLARPVPWTTAVILNGMIMTIYLWHSTASSLTMGLAVLLGNLGLSLEPGSGAWWLARPLWLVAYTIALAALMPLVARFERSQSLQQPASALRQVVGATVACAGLALLALNGLGGDTPYALQAVAVLTPFAGAALAGLLVRR